MKVFVFAYNRFDTMSTPNFLYSDEITPIILCHSSQDRAKFIEAGTARAKDIVATGRPKGLTGQRNIALEMMKDGEWALFMNDDLAKVTMLAPEFYDSRAKELDMTGENVRIWNDAFNTEITAQEFLRRCEQMTQICDKNKIHLGAFVPHSNTMFRKKRYSTRGLADGRAWLIKKQGGMSFDENVNVLEDHEWTARNLLKDGRVLINNWICPDFKRMSKGGFGTLAERETELRHDCAYLIQKYPKVFEYKSKPGYPPYTQLKFKI